VTSQKSIVTVRRDSIESAPLGGGAFGTAAGGAAAPRGVPQDGQNLAPSGSSAPQLEHEAASAVPQDAQNLAPAADSAPQFGQNAMR
jgi:hypothetical protein